MIGARQIAIFVCEKCGARREREHVHPRGEGPPCGELHTEMHRFGDGGWLRTEQWEPHGPMKYSHSVAGNPLQAQRDAADAVRERRAAATRP